MKRILFLLLLTSCAPSISHFNDYQKQFITKSNFLPSEAQINNKTPKVVVFALDENGNDIAKQAGLGLAATNNIENILSRYKLAQLIDRGAATKLQKEIALAEMNKTGSYKGPQIADYAISGAISNASFTSKYSSGYTFINPKTHEIITVPPRYTYSAEVGGNIKIYELPNLAVTKTIEFKGKASRVENVQQKGGLQFGAIQIGGEKVEGTKRDDNLVRNAAQAALNDIDTDLRNELSAIGYILEKRVYKNKEIFKINLGSNNGLAKGDNFEVTGKYEVENPLTNKSEIEKRVIAHGKVSDKIDPDNSWVIIDDKEEARNIRIGDVVKMKYESGFFAKIARFFK